MLIKVKWLRFLMFLMPRDLYAYVLQRMIKEVIRKEDGVKHHLVWERIIEEME